MIFGQVTRCDGGARIKIVVPATISPIKKGRKDKWINAAVEVNGVHAVIHVDPKGRKLLPGSIVTLQVKKAQHRANSKRPPSSILHATPTTKSANARLTLVNGKNIEVHKAA